MDHALGQVQERIKHLDHMAMSSGPAVASPPSFASGPVLTTGLDEFCTHYHGMCALVNENHGRIGDMEKPVGALNLTMSENEVELERKINIMQSAFAMNYDFAGEPCDNEYAGVN